MHTCLGRSRLVCPDGQFCCCYRSLPTGLDLLEKGVSCKYTAADSIKALNQVSRWVMWHLGLSKESASRGAKSKGLCHTSQPHAALLASSCLTEVTAPLHPGSIAPRWFNTHSPAPCQLAPVLQKPCSNQQQSTQLNRAWLAQIKCAVAWLAGLAGWAVQVFAALAQDPNTGPAMVAARWSKVLALPALKRYGEVRARLFGAE